MTATNQEHDEVAPRVLWKFQPRLQRLQRVQPTDASSTMMPYLHECREKSHGIEQRRNPCTHGALQFFAPIHQLRDPFQRIGEPTVQGSFTRPSNGFPTVQESGTKSGVYEKVVKKWCLWWDSVLGVQVYFTWESVKCSIAFYFFAVKCYLVWWKMLRPGTWLIDKASCNSSMPGDMFNSPFMPVKKKNRNRNSCPRFTYLLFCLHRK